jgi:outer membrane immunogenic protein
MIFSWTGGYIGIQGGGLWSNVDVGPGSDSFNGGLLGGYAGYNWQTGAWMVGAEGDINKVWNDQTFDVGNEGSIDVGSNYLASIRGRVGYAVDHALIFATAGVAFTDMDANATIFNNAAVNASKSFTGWTVGGGVDYAFTNNWIGRLEYRYYDFSNDTIDNVGDIGITNNTVTAGIAYKY